MTSFCVSDADDEWCWKRNVNDDARQSSGSDNNKNPEKSEQNAFH